MPGSLSIIMCNYNHAHCIGRALEAILTQSLRPMEVIVVDDGSTDNSVAVIEQIAKRDSIIRFICNGKNRGVMFSLARALEVACGAYVYFGSADDQILPGFFEKAMEMAKVYPQAGIIFGRMIVHYPEDEKKESYKCFSSRWTEPLFASPDVFFADYVEAEKADHSCTSSTIYKKKCSAGTRGFSVRTGLLC